MSGRQLRRGRRGDQKDGRRNNVSDEIFAESMKTLQSENRNATDSRLKHTEIDFRVEENRKAHHTDEYESKNLIVRRGQQFKISVTFDRPVNVEQHQIILQLATGSRPKQSKKSIIRLKAADSLSSSSWGMHIVEHRGEIVEMSVMSPADAIVGEYSVFVETRSKDLDGNYRSYRKVEAEKICILFNAWCKDDSVFMENEDHRQEYVLDEHGRIWIGSKNRYRGIPWNFGQFESVSLETCLKLLDMAEVKDQVRGYPHRICRAISKMVNSKDDDGVLIGNWSGYYADGTSPRAWAGSVAILKEFSKKKNPVKYGQCWVFSGLVTTLLRAIGIPTRSVTNFESAHDTDQSMTIDFHFDEEDNPIHTMNESVWNFHVWNESYFTRPDIPPGYDGWQAHDATPQEVSDGVYQCGPCPLKAIQSGEVYLPYDTGFVFAEVNGDRVYWQVDAEGEMSVSVIDKKSIGKSISTKAVGTNEREDLTNMYKFPEGNHKERKAVQLANKYSSSKDKDIYSTETSHDVDFKVLTSEEVTIGENFDIKLEIKNKS
ncbi:protein-glutamine gamma-glutamyltransferase K-like [Actinia tenebrosa]|uniref:protein-glutamine gamma-glutamyltransferase n=1 Tax=Actinia tenebrosa TaxID=6105 RepID=A0A6P8J3C9_ACTTE|nr:protein-glutamine gamma-glutamyltransferase K-like [Actinia tenebrosa]